MASEHRSNILFAFAIAVLLVFVYLARNVLLLVYISALSAVVIFPAVRRIMQLRIFGWRPGRGAAIFLVILAGVAALTVFLVFALPPIFDDLKTLAEESPRRSAEFSARLQRLPYADRIDLSALQQYAAGAIGGVIGVFKGIAGGLLGFFSWLVLTAYFIIDGEHAFAWALSFFPPQQRERLHSTLLHAERRVRNWLLGQLTLMLILGAASAIVFGLLRVKYFYALAVFAGVANIIPIVGPIATVVLAGLVAAIDGWHKVLGVIIFYLVYQQIESAYLTPRIMKASVDLPPLAVIIALSLGGAIAGFLGALMAVPTAALVAVLIDEYLVHKPAGKPAEAA